MCRAEAVPMCRRPAVCGSCRAAGGRVAVPPCGVSGQFLQKVCAGGFELVPIQSKAKEPAAEGVGGVVGGGRCGRAAAGTRDSSFKRGFSKAAVIA